MPDITRTIIWRNAAVAYLDNAIDYIRSSSPQNAQKVILEINAILLKAAKNPEHYPIDKYRKNNTGS